MTLPLTYHLDLQSHASYGHDLLTRKSSWSTVNRFRRQWKTDGRTDERTEAIALPAALIRSVMIGTSLRLPIHVSYSNGGSRLVFEIDDMKFFGLEDVFVTSDGHDRQCTRNSDTRSDKATAFLSIIYRYV